MKRTKNERDQPKLTLVRLHLLLPPFVSMGSEGHYHWWQHSTPWYQPLQLQPVGGPGPSLSFEAEIVSRASAQALQYVPARHLTSLQLLLGANRQY